MSYVQLLVHGYNGKPVYGFTVSNGDQFSSTIYLKPAGFRIFAKKHSISTAIAIFPAL